MPERDLCFTWIKKALGLRVLLFIETHPGRIYKFECNIIRQIDKMRFYRFIRNQSVTIKFLVAETHYFFIHPVLSVEKGNFRKTIQAFFNERRAQTFP